MGYQKIVILFLLSFWIILPTNINSHYCWGATISSKEPVFSLNIKDEPLKKVIEKISEATGYQIAIDEKWQGLLVTASLKDVSVHESIRGILKNINRIIISNDKEKKLSIIIYGSIETDQSLNKSDQLDLEVIPPNNPGGKGITQRALNAMKASEPKIDPLDLEVIQANNPGGKGITQRALNAMKASEPKIDPLDLEAIQADNPGGKGVTQRALIAMKASESKIDPLDLEAIPANNPGGKGVTQRELNAMRSSEPSIDPLDFEVIPPNNPGGKGVTQRELNAMKASEPKIDPLDLEVIPPNSPGV